MCAGLSCSEIGGGLVASCQWGPWATLGLGERSGSRGTGLTGVGEGGASGGSSLGFVGGGEEGTPHGSWGCGRSERGLDSGRGRGQGGWMVGCRSCECVACGVHAQAGCLRVEGGEAVCRGHGIEAPDLGA
eukprot:155319-Pelagomonas_calceolata.AAC.4